jgi:LacI family transcriptional regulator
MNITTKEVAKEAGVSQSTVSRVLNSYPYVSEDNRSRVWDAVEKLRYQPNHLARSMALQKTNTLGLLVPDLMNPFYSEIAKSIIDRGQEFKLNIILCDTDNKPEMQKFYIDFLQQKRVDGIIFASVSLRDPEAERLVNAEYPCIFCNRRLKLKKASFISSDNQKGAKLAVRHLAGLGHRRIGYISGPDELSTARDRLMGYREVVEALGLEADSELVVQGRFDRGLGYSGTMKLMDLPKPPTAIFVSNDLMALAAMEALMERGLRIPEDVALVGYDDISITGHKRIGLTTVAQQKDMMGRLAVDTMIAMLAKENGGTKPVHTYLEPKLIIRDSCGAGKLK